MIAIEGLKKKFRIEKKKLAASETEHAEDPRQDGRWFHAVRDVSFHCDKGEVLGLLGPNGAGKTTTLRMLSTALQPDAGSINVESVDAIKDPLAARKKLGFLSGTTGLYRRLTVKENIEYFGRLHQVEEEELQKRIDNLFTMLDMHSFAAKKAEDLSTGMRQKTSIARAVIHNPEVLVLDEPTTGLDVVAAKTILDFIQGYKDKGHPVIFSTHHLHEVEKLCDRVALINYGKSCFDGTVEDFRGISKSGDLYDSYLELIKRKGE
jgi:sodium transport system ATP-binding protein